MADGALMVVVAGALIDKEARVLLQQRPAGKTMAGLWEFPGGKIERGEVPKAALVRELAEELGIDVRTSDLTPVTFAEADSDGRHLLLLLYRLRFWSGEVRALAASGLRWERPATMRMLPMPPADVPLVAALAALLDGGGCGD